MTTSPTLSAIKRGVSIRPLADGFTVIELLATMAIISILVGLSIASFSRVGEGPALDVAQRETRTLLAAARSNARGKSSLGRLLFMPGSPAQVRSAMGREAGSWHFDIDKRDQAGGRGNFAKLRGASIESGGTVQNCAEFNGGDVIVCEEVAGYEPYFGFDLSFDLKPMKGESGGVLASFGSSFSFEFTDDGGLSASIELQDGQESVIAKTAPNLIESEQWCRVRVTFDGLDLRLYAHNVMEAEKRVTGEDSNLPRALAKEVEKPFLVFGSKAFKGRLDEAHYRTVEEEEITVLADGQDVSFQLQSPLELRFDAEGRLDSRFHESIVALMLSNEEGEKREIKIDLTGVIR